MQVNNDESVVVYLLICMLVKHGSNKVWFLVVRKGKEFLFGTDMDGISTIYGE